MHASNTSRTLWKALIGAGAVAALGACMSTTPSGFPDENGGPGNVLFRDVCQAGRPGGGAMQCMAKIVVKPDGSVQQSSTPQGYGPPDLRSAYNLPTSGGNGRIIAIVDANDDPTAEADLGVYRAQYGLPACTTANGCFKKVNQAGAASPLPAVDTGWAGEISLDLDMASAACPDCKILLVEADSATDADLGTAVNTAASIGASAISNSYGGGEDSSVTTSSSQYYDHPGVLVTASSGDQAYGAEFPATSQYVLAVGGTSLSKSSSARGWSETAWNSGGSGCSGYIPKPSWQTDTGCSKRTEADVSAVADPNTGVAVYETTGASGWVVYGGTSVASPLVASIFTLLNLDASGPSFPYSHTSDFYDVTSGSNGTCSPAYLCTAGAGYDGPTGWGTPNGAALTGGSSSSSSGSSSGFEQRQQLRVQQRVVERQQLGVERQLQRLEQRQQLGGSSSGSSSGGGGGTCAHSVCTRGSHLTDTCSTCADDVCSVDPYCCSTLWDRICVREVRSYCAAGTCP